MKTATKANPEIHEINPGDRVRISDYQNGLGLNNKAATVTTSNRSGYYLKVDGMKAIVHLSNLEGVQCLTKLTPGQEQLTPTPTPEPETMTITRKRGRPKKDAARQVLTVENRKPPTPQPRPASGDDSSSSPANQERPASPPPTDTNPQAHGLPAVKTSTADTIYQLDLTTKKLWISPDQIEEVSFTQIREAVDSEAIANYAELMQSDLWDFKRSPLPVIFEHEKRYLVGDGHHRIEAARKMGGDILCEIFPALQVEDAILYSVTAIENSQHGLPLRPKDQRKRINMFLDLLDSGKLSIALPQGFDIWSSRAIATYLKLPESGYRTILNIRNERAKPPEEPPILKALSNRPLKQPTGLPVNNHTPDPTTDRPASGDDSSSTVAISLREANANEERPARPPIDTHSQAHDLPPTDDTHLSDCGNHSLTDQERKNLGLITKLDQSVNTVINWIDRLDNEQLLKLGEAIQEEGLRRAE